DNIQYVFVDTPGLHLGQKKLINRVMNNTVMEVLREVDVVLFVTERAVFNEEDENVLRELQHVKVPVLWLINKCDQLSLSQRDKLLPHIEGISARREFAEVIPIVVLTGHNLDRVLDRVAQHLPEGPFMFPDDQVTDRS